MGQFARDVVLRREDDWESFDFVAVSFQLKRRPAPESMSLPSKSNTPPASVTALPVDQRAWVLHRTGDPRINLILEEKWPVPKPGTKQILIRISAAALNRELPCSARSDQTIIHQV